MFLLISFTINILILLNGPYSEFLFNEYNPKHLEAFQEVFTSLEHFVGKEKAKKNVFYIFSLLFLLLILYSTEPFLH